MRRRHETSNRGGGQSGWRAAFGSGSEAPYRRRTTDWLRVAVGSALLLLAARHAGGTTATERALFDVFNTLPGSLLPLFRGIYRLGALWTVGLVVAAAVIGRRWRLAGALLLAGVLAWSVGRALGEIVVEGATLGHSVRAVSRLGSSASFPAVRLAVVVAVTRTAGPYVTRPTKWAARTLVVGFAMSGLYLGTALPNDVFAGIVLGWVIAATVHLLLGSPGGRPTLPQITRSLAELGVLADDVRMARRQPRGSTLFWAQDRDGPLRVKVIGRDEADAQFLAKAWRFFVYKDSGPRLALSRVQQVEHEAYVLLQARDRGVKVPQVVAAGAAGPRAAVLVQRPVRGVRLSSLDASRLDASLLARVWEQVVRLHGAGIVHGQLDADHVVIDDAGEAWLVGFAAATASALPDLIVSDVAQLMAATAAVVSDHEALQVAKTVMGTDRVLGALSWLHPTVVTGSTMRLLDPHRGGARQRLEQLRKLGADTIGVETPELVQLQRVRVANIAFALGTLVAVAVLLSEIGDPGEVLDALRNADLGWIAVAVVLSFAANVGYAIGLQGTVARRLPLWPTTELQVGMSFSNLAIPGIGGTGMQVRFLQRQGIDLTSAIAAGGLLSTVGNLVAAVALFVLALALEPGRVDISLLPTSGLAELTGGIALGVVVITAVVGAIPRLRQAVFPPVRKAWSTMSAALRSPRQLTLLFGGNILAALLCTWCLAACLAAFGGTASFWALLAANIGVVTISSIVPIPGGGNAVGTVGLSAALVAFGVPRDIAVATVLTNQLIFYYLPAIPGWFATKHLARSNYL